MYFKCVYTLSAAFAIYRHTKNWATTNNNANLTFWSTILQTLHRDVSSLVPLKLPAIYIYAQLDFDDPVTLSHYNIVEIQRIFYSRIVLFKVFFSMGFLGKKMQATNNANAKPATPLNGCCVSMPITIQSGWCMRMEGL